MNSQLILGRRRMGAIMATVACALVRGGAASADQRDDALDKAIPAALARTAVPGVIVGIWQDGRAPYVRAFGVQDTATRKPMASDLQMRIGSTTKSFVATAILILADQGKLALDDPIGKYVAGVPNGDTLTLRQLAAMRSGLYNYADDTTKDTASQPHKQWTPGELLAVAFRHPPLFPPGREFDYCNTNTVLLGLVVEKLSGQTLASFLEQNILKPLGLKRTVFPADAAMPSPHAKGYYKMPDGKMVDATDWNPSWGWAAGNMISTLEDLRVWAKAFGEGRLISPAMKKERDQFLPAPGEGEGALYGLAIENQNGWVGHNGNTFTYMAYPYYHPAEKTTLVVLLNTGADIPGSWKMMQDIARIISPNHPWTNLPKI